MATKFWELANEDSKAALFRASWAQSNKGSWNFTPQQGFFWVPEQSEEIVIEEVKTPKKKKKVTKNK